MSRHQRLNEILELLSRHGQVEVDSLARALRVSPATVRRDLDHLADRQLLTRTHGGAVPAAAAYDLPLRYGSTRGPGPKAVIGAAAAAMVRRGSTIALNGGTTTGQVARAIATHPDLTGTADDVAVTVVTNALNIATELAVRPHVKIVVVGGVARPQTYELIGPLAEGVLAQVTMDIAFLGVDAVDPEGGAMARHEGEASVNRLLAARSRRVVIVAEHAKIGGSAFARICGTSEFDTVITDAEPGRVLRSGFADRGVEIVVATA